jgi:hypothetical protein
MIKEQIMSRCRKDPMRAFTEQEQQALVHITRAGSERADVATRAR